MTRVANHPLSVGTEAEIDSPSMLVAPQFDNPMQQFSAAKLGMWLFLATEILLFGSLFCLYAVTRASRPEIFAYGSRYLDPTWGTISTCILIFSSLTMALAVWSAQVGHRRALCLFLGLTVMCGLNYLGIKYIEYSQNFHNNLVWGVAFYEDTDSQQRPVTTTEPEIVLEPGDLAHGKQIYLRTCLSCHGVSGGGLPGLGKPLTSSQFLADISDEEFVRFLRIGRSPKDSNNTSGLAMPARGGNPRLVDQDLMDVVAHVRLLRETTSTEITESDIEAEFVITHSNVPPAAIGPTGLVKANNTRENKTPQNSTLVDPRHDPNRPAQAHLFFNLYFLMTGFHGIHVLVGTIVIGGLLVRALLGHFGTTYFTPIDLVGLHWHLIDMVWFFLFPLLYLVV